MTIAPLRATPEHTYAPPRLGEDYSRFRDTALRYGQDWAISYTGDGHGGVVYTGAHADGVQVATDSLDTFAVLLQVAAAQLPAPEPPPSRVRPYLVAWERRQAEQEARDLAALTRLTADVPAGRSP